MLFSFDNSKVADFFKGCIVKYNFGRSLSIYVALKVVLDGIPLVGFP
jgi:hypothetical protein